MTPKRFFLAVMLQEILPFTTVAFDCLSVQVSTAVAVSETRIADSLVLTLAADYGVEWTISPVRKPGQSQQLQDFYQAALKFAIPHQGNLLQCVAEADNTSCNVFLAKTLDAEVIGKLESRQVGPEVTLKTSYLFKCRVSIGAIAFVERGPLILTVFSSNEFAPEFNDTLKNIMLPELSPPNTTIVDLEKYVTDRDYGFGGSISSYILMNQTSLVALEQSRVVLKKQIDYDDLQFRETDAHVWLRLKAMDSGGTANTGFLIVQLLDNDTRPPYFVHSHCTRLMPCPDNVYRAQVLNNITGVLTNITPSQILAKDGDTLNAEITYSLQGENNIDEYVKINALNGEITLLKTLEDFDKPTVHLILMAREVTPLGRSSIATLLLEVESSEDSEKVITPDIATVGSSKSNSEFILPTLLSTLGVICLGAVCMALYVCRKRKKNQEAMDTVVRLSFIPGDPGANSPVEANQELSSTSESPDSQLSNGQAIESTSSSDYSANSTEKPSESQTLTNHR